MARRTALIAGLLITCGLLLWWTRERKDAPPSGTGPAQVDTSIAAQDERALPMLETAGQPPRDEKAKPTTDDEVIAALTRLEREYSDIGPKDAGIGLARRWATVGAPAVPFLLRRAARLESRWEYLTSWHVADDAIYLIGWRAAHALRAAFDDEDAEVRVIAARLLWEVGGRADEALPQLAAYLERERPWTEKRFRSMALRTLWQMGPEARPIHPLIRRLTDVEASTGVPQDLVRRRLPQPGRESWDRLRTVGAWALAILGRMGGDASTTLADLERAARSNENDRRQATALRALLTLGEPGLAALDRMLRGDDPVLADRVAAVLLLQKPKPALLVRAMRSGPPRLRARCMQTLANAADRDDLPSPPADWVDVLEEALGSTDEVVSVHAAFAMAKVATSPVAKFETNKRAKKLLIAALEHTSPKTRSEAAHGLSLWWMHADARQALMDRYATLDTDGRAIVLFTLSLDDTPDARRNNLLRDALQDAEAKVQVQALRSLNSVMEDRQRLATILEAAKASKHEAVRKVAKELAETLSSEEAAKDGDG